MKKILSLLGVVTITSSGVTTLTSNNFLLTNTTSVNNIYMKKLTTESQLYEKNYRFLHSDSLKVRINFEQAQKIAYYFQIQLKKEFIKYLVNLIKKLPQADHSGAGGSITENDYYTSAVGIWEKFPLFHELIIKLQNEGRVNGITFVRLVSGDYYEDKYTVLETGGEFDK